MQMYYEYDIRKRIEELEFWIKYWTPVRSYKLYEAEARLDELKWILGESDGSI